MGELPDTSYADSLSAVSNQLQAVRERISKSSIPQTHEPRHIARELKASLLELKAKEVKPSPAPTVLSPSSAPAPQHIQLPKIALSTFEGDIMKWVTFWSQFRAAVDDNPKRAQLILPGRHSRPHSKAVAVQRGGT